MCKTQVPKQSLFFLFCLLIKPKAAPFLPEVGSWTLNGFIQKHFVGYVLDGYHIMLANNTIIYHFLENIWPSDHSAPQSKWGRQFLCRNGRRGLGNLMRRERWGSQITAHLAQHCLNHRHFPHLITLRNFGVLVHIWYIRVDVLHPYSFFFCSF